MQEEKIMYETAECISHFCLSGHLFLCDDYLLHFPLERAHIPHLYPSVRHAMVAEKTCDEEKRHLIATSTQLRLPANLKEYERALPPPVHWSDAYVIGQLYWLTLKKFLQCDTLRAKLIATDPKELYNGLGKGEGRYDILDHLPVENNYNGRNLMAVRDYCIKNPLA